jgi:hypothetical protein
MANSWRMSRNRRALLYVAIFVVIIALAFIGVRLLRSSAAPTSNPGGPGGPGGLGAPSAKRYWIIEAPVLNELVASPSVRSALAGDTIFVPDKKAESLSPLAAGLHIVQAESFTSEATLANAIAKKTIPSTTKALLYDNEKWSLTPSDERANPAMYYQRAASLAHAHGYMLIATPGDPNIGEQIATYVDVLDIQSQQDQAVADSYAGHVLPVAEAARKANGKLIILTGLSTNPAAGVPTSEQLVDDAHAVSGVVQGYWLNVPTPGTACPRCKSAQPQLAVQFLAALGAS